MPNKFAGKAETQRADLMDYGSLYGMGSYYGQDYTAWTLIRLAGLVENNLAQTQFGKPYAALMPEQQAGVRDAMRAQLQHIDLTQRQVAIPMPSPARYKRRCVPTSPKSLARPTPTRAGRLLTASIPSKRRTPRIS